MSGCERLAEVVVVADHIPMPEQGYAGTDTLDKTRGPDGGYSIRYWAARKGGDTILVTSVKPSLTKAIAFRCGTY